MAPEAQALQLGERLGSPVRVEWDAAALRESGNASWRVSGELDAQRIAELRLLSAAFDDGSLLAVAALRPRDARGHGSDELAAILARSDAEPAAASEVRLSIEYDGAGQPRRAGLELYADPDSPPVRIAADRDESAAPRPSDDAIAMRFRLDGTPGAGTYEARRP